MTVQRICANNYPGIQKPKAGRKEVLSSTSKRCVARISQVTDAENVPQIWQRLREETGIDVSHDTINCALKEVGLKASYKPKKPRLLPKHIKAHKEFAERYKNWTEDDWRRVIWSDKTTVERFGAHGRQWIWRKPGALLRERDIQKKVKFGGGSVMIWGCMGMQGVGYSCRIEGSMTTDLYFGILEDELLKTLKYYKIKRKDIIFQQDNASIHTSPRVTKWLENHKIEVLQ